MSDSPCEESSILDGTMGDHARSAEIMRHDGWLHSAPNCVSGVNWKQDHPANLCLITSKR